MPFKFSSRRSFVAARNGMVAASQPLAALSGIQILMDGGNAADAAIAAAAALAVTEPMSTGLGGDCFALYYEARSQEITALNGSGRAPSGLSLDLLAEQGITGQLAANHPHTITVPGACAGWCDLIHRHGSMTMGEILAPAIRLAREGFPVAPIAAQMWDSLSAQLCSSLGGRELTIDGLAPRAGEIFRNPGLAATLSKIAEGGKEAFYRGHVAEAIVRTINRAGGVMTLQDLAGHESTWEEPISTSYRGFRVWECPPNGQGLAALLALNVLEGFELDGQDPLEASRLHLMVEAMRVAFGDTAWYVADPRFSEIPLARLLSKDYAATRRSLIDPNKATMDYSHGAPVAGSDTVYLCAVDGQGNACSFINSVYMGFGTGIVPEGLGFSLQNRGHCFSLDLRHPNALAPGKRPYHTIIPGMLTLASDGALYAPFGVMGGFMQPQGHVQVVVGLVDDGLDPQSALDRPRFCLSEARPDSRLLLEEGIPVETMRRLAEMGHVIEPVSGFDRSAFGRGQIIRRMPDGVLIGGSDPRGDGCAIGF